MSTAKFVISPGNLHQLSQGCGPKMLLDVVVVVVVVLLVVVVVVDVVLVVAFQQEPNWYRGGLKIKGAKRPKLSYNNELNA